MGVSSTDRNASRDRRGRDAKRDARGHEHANGFPHRSTDCIACSNTTSNGVALLYFAADCYARTDT